MDLSCLKPSADKKILILLAGLIWICSGIMLISMSIIWLSAATLKDQILFFSAGFLVAMPIHHFGFLRIANKNLRRLMPGNDKRCIFSFMSWKSYLIIPVMASMGFFIRHSGIPKQYIAVIYGGIGLALFLSGIRYARYFRLLSVKKDLRFKDLT